MKTTQTIAALALLQFGALAIHAAITIPGANNGTDGALNITADTVYDLSKAVTGVWDADNSANNVPGELPKGIYDPEKWAVVFKYSGVTVAAGKTVTFKNHASRAPVVWLVSGNVTINGTVSLDGQNSGAAPALAEAGPGGFRGGAGSYGSGVSQSAGFGPGGAAWYRWAATGASYATEGTFGEWGWASKAYGNPSLIPLIGGSGGGGWSKGGGGGGGAILIACGGALNLTGELRANGGYGNDGGGGGSGGGIRIVADSFAGTGVIRAIGSGGGGQGGLGRIRFERVSSAAAFTIVPDPSLVPLAPGDTALLWPPSGSPLVKIVSVAGQNPPMDPRAEFGSFGADVTLPQLSSADVIIETTNVEQASVLKVRGMPRSSGGISEVDATILSVVSTTPLIIQWKAALPVQTGYSAVQVKVVRP
jgi:plastocyanin